MSAINLIQFQKQPKGMAKQNFEFWRTRNGINVLEKDMVDCQAVKAHFKNTNLSYCTFYAKSQKPVKAVIHQLHQTSPAEGISDGLVGLSFNVISVKDMSTAC
jgi:hypothetical protein